MYISCELTPTRDAVDLAAVAEELGYARLWVADSPSIYPDVWMTLTRMAERTSRIGLGPAVIVPSLRHVAVTASSIGTLADMAPGRVAAALGRGFTGRELLGQPPMRLDDVEAYFVRLRALLAGQEVEVDGTVAQMLHAGSSPVAMPVDVPLLLASNGPRGAALARRVADGMFSVVRPQPGFAWASVILSGTVLDPGEDVDSERVRAAAGPAVIVRYHYAATFDREALATMPGGPEWLARCQAVPERTRHLRVHEDHYLEPSELDRDLVTPETLRNTFTGTAEELRARLAELEAAGATEVVYHPSGDVERELHAFAAMAGLSAG